MADSRTLAAKLKISKEGDAELLGKTADEIEEMERATTEFNAAADGLGRAAEAGFSKVEAGSANAASAVVKIGVALDNYRNKLREAEEAGAHIGEGQRAELARLEE